MSIELEQLQHIGQKFLPDYSGLKPSKYDKTIKRAEAFFDQLPAFKIQRMVSPAELLRDSNITFTHPPLCLQHPHGMFQEYNFQTVNGHRWNIQVANFVGYDYVNGNMEEMRQTEIGLGAHQNLSGPESEIEKAHWRTIMLVAGNLDTFDKMLTGRGNSGQKRRPVIFPEVDFKKVRINKNGDGVLAETEYIVAKPDIVFIGSDNRFYILEFGNSYEKPEKLAHYANELKNYYEERTDKVLLDDRIRTFVIRYQHSENVDELQILPSDIAEIQIATKLLESQMP